MLLSKWLVSDEGKRLLAILKELESVRYITQPFIVRDTVYILYAVNSGVYALKEVNSSMFNITSMGFLLQGANQHLAVPTEILTAFYADIIADTRAKLAAKTKLLEELSNGDN